MAVPRLLRPVMEAKSILAPLMKEEDELRIAHLRDLIVLGADLCQSRTLHARYPRRTRDPEGNTRFPQQLAQIGRGWAALMGDDAVTEEGMKLIARVGLDCIPPRRGEVLKALMRGKNPYSLGLPHSVVERSIEDLKQVGLVEKPDRGAKLSEQALCLLDGARILESCSISPQFLHENGREYVN